MPEDFKKIIQSVGLEIFENNILEATKSLKELFPWMDEETILRAIIEDYLSIQKIIHKNFSDRFYTSKEEIIENLNKQQKEKWERGRIY